jgi:predicted transcriptional regulator
VPPFFLERLNELKSCSLVKPDPDNIFEPSAVFLENIKKSKNILAFSSIFHPIFSEIFLDNEDNDSEISLIVTTKVYERLKNDFEKELKLYLSMEKKKLFVCVEEIKIAMLIKTEFFMTADVLTSRGAFDQETIIGFEPASMKWAEDLIQYYKNRAQEI